MGRGYTWKQQSGPISQRSILKAGSKPGLPATKVLHIVKMDCQAYGRICIVSRNNAATSSILFAQHSMTGRRGRSTANAANVPSSAGVSQLDLVRKSRDTCRCEKDAVRGLIGPSAVMGPIAMDDVAGVCELQLLHQRGGVQCRDGARPCTMQVAFQQTAMTWSMKR